MKIWVSVRTNRLGSEVEDELELDDEDFEGMGEQEREEEIEAIAKDWMWNNIEWNFREITDETD